MLRFGKGGKNGVRPGARKKLPWLSNSPPPPPDGVLIPPRSSTQSARRTVSHGRQRLRACMAREGERKRKTEKEAREELATNMLLWPLGPPMFAHRCLSDLHASLRVDVDAGGCSGAEGKATPVSGVGTRWGSFGNLAALSQTRLLGGRAQEKKNPTSASPFRRPDASTTANLTSKTNQHFPVWF